MPPRSEHELDPVTLHNQALMNMEQNPTEGFEKLQFLIQQNPFPPETFPNLLLLYVKYEVRDVLIEERYDIVSLELKLFVLAVLLFCLHCWLVIRNGNRLMKSPNQQFLI